MQKIEIAMSRAPDRRGSWTQTPNKRGFCDKY